MSIIDTFDNQSEEIIKPWNVVEKVNGFPEVVIVTFSERIFELLLSYENVEQISNLSTGFIQIPIYKINWGGKEYAVYLSMLGGSASAALMEEVIAKGGRKFLFFGSCGVLDSNIVAGHLIVHTSAYRDEGVSYHYMQISDYVDINTADKLANIFEELDYPYVKTKTWTTAAFYRETKNNMMKRKADGCLVVEMECASLAEVAQFRNVEFYQFLFTEDSLDGVEWDSRIMGKLTKDDRRKYLSIALEVASRI